MLDTGKHPGTPVKSKSPKKPSKGAVEDTKKFVPFLEWCQS